MQYSTELHQEVCSQYLQSYIQYLQYSTCSTVLSCTRKSIVSTCNHTYSTYSTVHTVQQTQTPCTDFIYINKTEFSSGFSPGRQVENRFCTVLYRYPHLSPNTGQAGRRILLSLIRPLLLPLLRATQTARTCQKPPGWANRSCWREAASHWSRGSGGGRCPVTWRHTWGALTAHVATPKSSCWLSYIPSMPTFIVKRGSGGRSQSCTVNSSYKQKIQSKCRNWTSLLIYLIYSGNLKI